ncbi:MAG: 16S rRNA processing protein RimM [Lachnospiraceae bacterium]|nr:16S rRNA processing protein RimM [Lachnospiraceae bacterium]
MTEEFQVGVITSTHGLKGEVKVFPTTDDVRRFKRLKEVTAHIQSGTVLLHIRSVKFFKQFVIIGFEEYDDINKVEHLIKASLTVDRSHAVKLSKDEYYVSDLMGLKCLTDTGEELGIITDVLATGANDVYVVDHDGTELLIPAIKDCIMEVDVESGFIKVHLLEGLI